MSVSQRAPERAFRSPSLPKFPAPQDARRLRTTGACSFSNNMHVFKSSNATRPSLSDELQRSPRSAALAVGSFSASVFASASSSDDTPHTSTTPNASACASKNAIHGQFPIANCAAHASSAHFARATASRASPATAAAAASPAAVAARTVRPHRAQLFRHALATTLVISHDRLHRSSTPIDVSRRPNARRASAKNPCARARLDRIPPSPPTRPRVVPERVPRVHRRLPSASIRRSRSSARRSRARARRPPRGPSRRRRARPQKGLLDESRLPKNGSKESTRSIHPFDRGLSTSHSRSTARRHVLRRRRRRLAVRG